MGQQTHIFTGMQVAERQFGVIPEDAVIMEAGTNNSTAFTNRLLEKYPRVVAYTFHKIVSRNGNNIDARHLKAPIIWIPEREKFLEGIIQSSNAMFEGQDIKELDEDDSQLSFSQKRLSGVLNTIRGRIGYALSSDVGISLSNGIAKYPLHSHQRLDGDFVGFPHSR